MIKKIAAVAAAGALALALAGCSGGSESGSGDQTQAEEKAPKAVEEVVLVDSGWSAENGYIMYGVVLENKSDKIAEFPTVQITGKDAEGNVISSEDMVLSEIQPGETVAYGGQSGNGTAPSSVEFTVLEPDFVSNGMYPAASYELSEVNAVDSGYGMWDFVGQITNTSETDVDGVAVSVLLYKDGRIVAGYTGFVDSLTAGMTQSFSAVGYDVPEFDECKAYAMVW